MHGVAVTRPKMLFHRSGSFVTCISSALKSNVTRAKCTGFSYFNYVNDSYGTYA